MKYIIITIILALAAWFILDALNQPGVQDLNGEFEEVAFYRNENNTGPVVRIYAVTVEDTLWDEMTRYGNYMPHTKYGNTKVYFFQKGNPVPENVFPGEDNFTEEFKQYCLALYEKDAMGNVQLIKSPY